ncbi:MAG: class I SAM-dependent methyltransferase [Planctomycetota bacterium]
MALFYEQALVPTHSCILMESAEEAKEHPRGEMKLGYCPECGFISNLRYDPSLEDYTGGYEESQHFSPRFREFAHGLSKKLVDTYALADKDAVEIGCGKGEFFALLCDQGAKGGVGIDPAWVEGRADKVSESASRIRFLKEFYSDSHGELPCDFVLCRHTLEHIHTPLDFLETIRRNLGDRKDAVVFMELPDTRRIMEERAFWDIYYEHCSYFTLGSLARAFRAARFEILELYTDYDDQYLMIAAKPSDAPTTPVLEAEDDLEEMRAEVEAFCVDLERKVSTWRKELDDNAGKRVVLWGSGSKAVGYLTTLGIEDEIRYVVDINPHKQGKFLPGTGQEIVSPEFLVDYQPHEVIVMNPVYLKEIGDSLRELGVNANLSACQ